jgi:hypothetical protein
VLDGFGRVLADEVATYRCRHDKSYIPEEYMVTFLSRVVMLHVNQDRRFLSAGEASNFDPGLSLQSRLKCRDACVLLAKQVAWISDFIVNAVGSAGAQGAQGPKEFDWILRETVAVVSFSTGSERWLYRRRKSDTFTIRIVAISMYKASLRRSTAKGNFMQLFI